MPPHRHPAAGQASAEYVAVLTLVGAALAGAGAVAGAAGVGTRVAHVVRTGICIVAGDVCRPADAEAAGLAPCTLSERRSGGGGAVTVLSLRLGGGREWTLARRSDGSLLVTRMHDRALGLSGGLGVEASPIGLELGASGSFAFGVGAGEAWELPDAAAARRFLAAIADGSADDERRWPPVWRFGEAGEELAGRAGLGAAGGGISADIAGIEASAGAALGVRHGRGSTTLYFRTEFSGLEAVALGERGPITSGAGPVLVEYTRDGGGPRELAFRVAEPGSRGGEVVETSARLDLRVPANRAVAARLLRLRAPWPPAVHDDLRAVVRQAVLAGVVERSVYAIHDASRDFAAALRLGAELGLEVDHTDVARRLLSASAWTGGTGPREREDCFFPAHA